MKSHTFVFFRSRYYATNTFYWSLIRGQNGTNYGLISILTQHWYEFQLHNKCFATWLHINESKCVWVPLSTTKLPSQVTPNLFLMTRPFFASYFFRYKFDSVINRPNTTCFQFDKIVSILEHSTDKYSFSLLCFSE